VKIEGDLDTMKIIGPSLRPFRSRDFTVCPACGLSANGWWRRTLRKIRGKRDEPMATMVYCQGDKPPTEECRPNPFDFMSFFRGEVINGCSGIPEPHLHCTCLACHAKWYTALKERI
jgi:hypothetical protein